MKKLLFQLDTDTHPSVFDIVAAHDGGVDHVIEHRDCTPDNVIPTIEGGQFSLARPRKKYTALFIGGDDMMAREGADITITSRKLANAQQACKDVKINFDVDTTAVEAADNNTRGKAIENV